MHRFALYALCAAAVALAVWLVLGTLPRGDSPGRTGEQQEDRAAVAQPGSAGSPEDPFGNAVRPATDPAHLRPVPPDPEREDLEAGIEEAARASLGGISDAGFPQPGTAERPRDGGGEEGRDAPVPTHVGGASAPVVTTFPPPGDPRELRSLANEEPVPSDATPIEPEPEPTGNLADPEVQPRILDNFPEGSLPSD